MVVPNESNDQGQRKGTGGTAPITHLVGTRSQLGWWSTIEVP
jgi:hypothetical protein